MTTRGRGGRGGVKRLRAVPCPGCGLPVVMDDAKCKVRHPSPICALFESKMKAFNLKPRFEPWTAAVVVGKAKGAG